MTKFVLDAGAVVHLVSEQLEAADAHELLAPTLLRSQALSAFHEAVHRGEVSAEVGRERHARLSGMRIRYLGDAVLRRRAFDLAEKLGWAATYDAEYVALTQLQADALVTLDLDLARTLDGIVRVASIEEVLEAPGEGRTSRQ